MIDKSIVTYWKSLQKDLSKEYFKNNLSLIAVKAIIEYKLIQQYHLIN